jgi:ornithine--oxo-acid transaminase
VLGKALSGGMLPVSAALCNDEIMLCIQPGLPVEKQFSAH